MNGQPLPSSLGYCVLWLRQKSVAKVELQAEEEEGKTGELEQCFWIMMMPVPHAKENQRTALPSLPRAPPSNRIPSFLCALFFAI